MSDKYKQQIIPPNNQPTITTNSEVHKNFSLDPMGDLAKTFNGIDVFPSLEQENRKLKDLCKSIQTKLNISEREIAKLRAQVNLSCEKMLDILSDGQEYGHTEDYTESKKTELAKHYSWKDKL